jgi:hypothetical protein
MHSGRSFDPFQHADAAPFVFIPSAASRATGIHASPPESSAAPLALLSVEQLEALLASLVGPEHGPARRRLRQRLKTLQMHQTSQLAVDAGGAADAAAVGFPPGSAHSNAQPTAFSNSHSPPPADSSVQRGFNPNVSWRAVTMQQLRDHPLFIALPPACRVQPSTPSDLRLFRQDSQQWLASHAGRITTSACAACLGLYEEMSAKVLDVPRSLRGHDKALRCHERLRLPLLNDLSLLRPELWHEGQQCQGNGAGDASLPPIWRVQAEKQPPSPFFCSFHPLRRKHESGSHRTDRSGPSINQIRMDWGSVQEATSILAAVNYFGRLHAVVEETGLQPFEAVPAIERCKLPTDLPPIGASPDAIVRWPDGTIEPLEVKNHSPFSSAPGFARAAGAPPFEVCDPGPYNEVAVWHIPQLYLHMLCLGDACSSALFMSCSATRGVNIFRLRRDSALMQAMLHFLARFNAAHGCGQPPPRPNFFWGAPGYSQLLVRLKHASRKQVEFVVHIPDADVQRGNDGRFFCD